MATALQQMLQPLTQNQATCVRLAVEDRAAATVAEVLKQNGYNTMALGKWHLAPYTAYTAAGPFDRWPLGMGIEKFYGFIGGETDQWAPLLVQDNQFIETPKRDGYHLSEDLADRAIAYIRDQQQASTDRPIFTYLPGTTASISAAISVRPCRSTTTTRRRLPSTAPLARPRSRIRRSRMRSAA